MQPQLKILKLRDSQLIKRLRRACVCFLLLLSPGLFAQNTTNSAENSVVALPDFIPADPAIANAGKRAILSQALNVIDQIATIVPGVGLNSIRLGSSFARVVQVLGPPQLANKSGIAYQLDSKTVIQFLGRKKVKTIRVEGLLGSVARVNNGITFGMRSGQVRNQFKQKPTSDRKNKIRYKNLGIEFEFKNDALFKVSVFPV